MRYRHRYIWDQGKLTGAIAVDKDFGYAPIDVNFINNSFSANNQTNSIITVWSFGNGTSLTTTDGSVPAKPLSNSPAHILLWAFITKNPCPDTVIKLLRWRHLRDWKFNIFTPNGDNANDVFYLHTTNPPTLVWRYLIVRGIWCMSLKAEPAMCCGMAKTNMVKCSEGTYYYTLKATGSDGNNYEQKGNINLVR